MNKKPTDSEIIAMVENAYVVDLINRLQAENERLKNAYEVYEETSGLKQAKAEAYKEFAEKLENKIRFLENRGFSIHYVVKNALINLLKELVDNNG